MKNTFGRIYTDQSWCKTANRLKHLSVLPGHDDLPQPPTEEDRICFEGDAGSASGGQAHARSPASTRAGAHSLRRGRERARKRRPARPTRRLSAQRQKHRAGRFVTRVRRYHLAVLFPLKKKKKTGRFVPLSQKKKCLYPDEKASKKKNSSVSFVQDVARYCLPLESAVASNRCERIFLESRSSEPSGAPHNGEAYGREWTEQVARPFPFPGTFRPTRRPVSSRRHTADTITRFVQLDPVNTADGGVRPFPVEASRRAPPPKFRKRHPSHT